jgi:hypothetical protein
VQLGSGSNGLYQGGASFGFQPTADLRGQITFTWTLAGKVLGRASRMTVGHIKNVDFADPSGYSAATCVIK